VDSGGLEPVAVGPGNQYRPEVTSDGRWVLYWDHRPGGPDRIMRVPVSGGIAELVFTLTGWGIPRCSFRGRCVLEEFQGPDLVVSALDPVDGKGTELGRWRVPPGGGFCPLADGSAVAFLTEAGGRRTVIRVVSQKGEPPREIAVQNVANLTNLDPLPSGGFLSRDDNAGRKTLIFVRPDGTSRALWSPTNVEVQSAIASPDGRHFAINTTTTHANAWIVSGF
jgi:hypothetical protein